jgi:hypothetical protein
MSKLSLSLGVSLLLVLGCGSSSKPPVGQSCSLASECNNPLSCTFGRCHTACVQTRDCPAGQRCVKVTGGNVCQLDEEKRCPASGACQQPLICAIDLLCRNNCTTAADCTLGQMCASGTCAESIEVGSDGKLKVPDAGATPPAADGGSTVTVDGGVDAAPMVGNGPCGVPESEPNDKRENATPIAAPAMFTSCLGENKDVDFYELTAPNDPAGGYYEFSLTGITDFEADVIAYSAADNGELGHIFASSDGQDLHGYLAAAPGQKYRLAVGGFGGVRNPPAKYTLKVSYTKITDASEPNNTRDKAAPLALGTPVMGYIFEGIKGAQPEAPDIADWYGVMGAAGNITATVESVPTNMTVYIEIVDSAGKMNYALGPNDGANGTATLMGGAAGLYKVNVRPFTIRSSYFFDKESAPGDVPEHYTTPYKLTVTQ